MATWIVHLRLAENLLEMIGGLDSPQFAVGNVAPDSGIPDEKWEKFNPPVEVTHFAVSGDGAWRMADLEFYRCYLAPLKHQNDDRMCFSFRLGYFFHLVTDNLWAEKIARPTKDRFAAEFEADPEFGWEVKRDWYGLDLHYVRTHPESLFWRVFLGSEYTQNHLDFMPLEAVKQRLEYIKALYQRTDEAIERKYGQRPCKYLSEGQVEDFIRESTERLYGIYQRLWEEEGKIGDLSSALELLDDK
jgi:hypothetical protein